MKTCHHPPCFVSAQFQARLSRPATADSVHNRLPKAAAPPEHVVFFSPLSCNAATEQGLTQQLTREPKAETTFRAAGKGPAAVAALLAPLAGRMGLVPLSPRLSAGTGCPTERAQSIPWGEAGEHLCSEDVQGPNTGSCGTQPAGARGWPGGWCVAGLQLQLLPPCPGTLLPSQAASLAECPCAARPWVGFLTPAALLGEDYTIPITPQLCI